jgi:hypothetical protein
MRPGNETSTNVTFEVVLNRPTSTPYCIVAANSGLIPAVAIMMSAGILTKNPYVEGIVKNEVVEVCKKFLSVAANFLNNRKDCVRPC